MVRYMIILLLLVAVLELLGLNMVAAVVATAGLAFIILPIILAIVIVHNIGKR